MSKADSSLKMPIEKYEEECRRRLALARLLVIRKGPYFSKILYRLVPILVPGMGTVAVSDTMLLLVEPSRVVDDPELGKMEKGEPHVLAGVLVHEIMHILRDMNRVKQLSEVSAELANYAADMPINVEITRAGWQIPSWAVYPQRFGYPDDETMEQYFARLLKEQKQKGDLHGEGQSGPDIANGQCGSAAGNPSGKTKEAEQKHAQDARNAGEVEATKKATAEAAKQHFAHQGRGDAPGWVEELIQATRRKDRNWKRDLDQVVRRCTGAIMSGGYDFSMARPSKRSIIRQGVLRPGLVEQQYEAAIVFDTSGSMGEGQLAYAKNATMNIIQQTGVDTVWLAQCDAKMQQDFTRTKLRDVAPMKMKGRGGTDFRPIFGALKKMRPKPDLIVIFTDGDGCAPDAPPRGTSVVWVIVPSPWGRRPADWGHLIVCSDDHKVADPYYD